jgi:hypothetical protein
MIPYGSNPSRGYHGIKESQRALSMTAISEAKSSLKRIVLENNGDTNQQAVQDALENLQKLSAAERGDAEWKPTQNMSFHTGRWRTISAPLFPGRLLDEEDGNGKAKFSLGRMTFNMFKPTKSVCAVEQIVNIIEPIDETNKGDSEDSSEWEQSYDVEVLMEISVLGKEYIKLPAKLVNYGTCTPTSSTRLGVKFRGGTMQPNFDMTLKENEALMVAWKETFEGAITKEADAQSLLGKLATGATNVLMKVMMGLEPPVDCTELTQTYSIKRPIAGHLDILYMDNNLRITKGNRLLL